MDQSGRYSDLSLNEEDLIKGGKHILVAYKMKPKQGFGTYLACAAHFAAESSTGTNVEVSTTDDFTKGLDALVYYIRQCTPASHDQRPDRLWKITFCRTHGLETEQTADHCGLQ